VGLRLSSLRSENSAIAAAFSSQRKQTITKAKCARQTSGFLFILIFDRIKLKADSEKSSVL
jgi:hypothetical protein